METKAMSNIKQSIDYDKGYKDGFIEGGRHATELLAKVFAVLPAPPLEIIGEHADKVRKIIESDGVIEVDQFEKEYGQEFVVEETCPKCGWDMKEFVTCYKCRNLACRHKIKKEKRGKNV